MSSSGSSTPQQEKLKDIVVDMEEPTENNNLKQRSFQGPLSERRTESLSFRSGPLRTGIEIMKFYPSRSNKIYTCVFCKKGFSTSQALGGHQNAHKNEREWDKKRKEMEANFPGLAFLTPYLDKPHLLLGGYSQDALSNENHLGITLDPFKHLGSRFNPTFNSGLTRGTLDMTIVPRMTPTHFFTGNNSTYGSSSMGHDPLPSYNNIRPIVSRNTLANNFVSQENVLKEENFISKIGKDVVVEIDDDDDVDQPEVGKSKTCGIDLTLSL